MLFDKYNSGPLRPLPEKKFPVWHKKCMFCFEFSKNRHIFAHRKADGTEKAQKVEFNVREEWGTQRNNKVL